MVNLKLEDDEGIIQQTNNVEMYKENDVYEEIYEMYLTNKNIICYYEKSNGLFSKSEEVLEKIPLQSIRIVNGKLQISKVNDYENGLRLQIILQNGNRVHFVFDKKKEFQIWYDSIIEIITGEKIENNNLSNNKEEKVKEFMDSEEKKGMYCNNCGEQLLPNSKFCNYCGTPMDNTKKEKKLIEEKKETIREEFTKRKMVYEGKIHKCPNCGEVLEALIVNCPACGYELRDSKNSSAVEELSRKLEEIEEKRDKSRVSTQILGIFNLSVGLTKNDEQKISLIRNFPIPNTKEDLFEFLILSKSNIEIDAYENTQIKSARLAVSDAWKAKFEQAYQKAKLLFKNDERMIEINKMYEEIDKSINKAKRKYWIITSASFGVLVVMIVLPFGLIGLTGGFSSDKTKSDNSSSESISIVENKDIDTNKSENIYESVKEIKDEQKNSVSLGDNIIVNNNEYIEIKEVGYTRTSSFLKCIVTISNNSKKAIDLPSFRVTAYNKEGKILGSEERVVSLIYPNHSMVDEGTLIEMSEEPDKIEVTMLEPDDYNIKDVSTLKHPQYNEMKCQNIFVNSSKVTGEVYNPNDYIMECAKVTIVFRDENNKIVESECSFVRNIPANGKLPFDISLPSDTIVTDKIEATACIW